MTPPEEMATLHEHPRGVVSMVFTDIVGSTELWSADEEGMARDLERHDAVLDACVAAEKGTVVKHMGDGMAAIFPQPEGAIRAAAAIQRSIAEQEWARRRGLAVRAAVHSGVAQMRSGDIFGVAVNRAARLMSLCPGGAVLVSEATARLVSGRPSPDLVLVEIAHVQLRSFAESEMVHAVRGPGLADVAVTDLPSPGASALGFLPTYEDALIGRDDDLAALVGSISANSLVTVVGTGGLGKTRLAVAAAASIPSRPDGVWWCDLSSATADGTVDAVALKSVGAIQQQGRTATESLCEHLARAQALLILDNCEHVIDGVRTLVQTLRAACPRLHIVCTSREELRVRGERVMRLAELSASDARALFVERVAAIRPDIEWDAPRIAAADAICERLDRIPLAIELAAARCRALSPVEVAARLDQRFRLLRDGVGEGRHRTLEAAVEWSYSLLGADEQTVFDMMAVFPGGASLAAVAAVTGWDELDVADTLASLVSRSMVNVADTALGTRYRQFETMRQFAADRLAETGREAEAGAAFVRWAVTVADGLDAAFLGSDETWAMRSFAVEFDNLRAATSLAARTDDLRAAGRILEGLARWALYRPAYDLLTWVADDDLVAACGTDVSATVVALLGEIALLAGETDRARRLAAAAASVSPTDVAVSTTRAGLSIWVDGDPDTAESLLADASPASAEDRFGLDIYRMHVATVRWMSVPSTATDHDVVPLVEMGRRLVAQRRSAGSTVSLAHGLAVLGYLQLAAGSFDDAIASARAATETARQAEAWFAVNAAQICLVTSFGQVQARRPEMSESAARELRSVLDETLQHRNWFFVGTLLASAAPLTLWSLGATREALVVQAVGSRHYPSWPSQLPRRATAALDEDTVKAADAEAALLDLGDAADLTIRAIDTALRPSSRPSSDPVAEG